MKQGKKEMTVEVIGVKEVKKVKEDYFNHKLVVGMSIVGFLMVIFKFMIGLGCCLIVLAAFLAKIFHDQEKGNED
ncbi:hypothetical protein [Aquitalea pelogenes]|uniref:hypothetical protein n=1 Tax=Aquitalea pelogenes TaxID=1293573 RepID=UPI0035B26905